MTRRGLTTGRVLVKTCQARCYAPAHIDVLAGSARLAHSLDGDGSIDRCVKSCCSGMRVRRVFHARETFNAPGERGTGYSDDERALGLDRVYALELSDPGEARRLAEDLRDLDDVEWAMPEPLTITPLDALPEERTRPDREMIEAPRRLIRADEALEIEPGSATVIAGVVDTGVALRHAEFAGRCFGGFDTVDLGMGRISEDMELVGDSRGPDFSPADETGHGSHVTGIIAANGLRVPRGLGGALRVAPIRALAAARDREGRIVGIGGTLDLDAGIKAACELGCHVINMSFGTPESALDAESPALHRDVVAYAAAQGAVMVAAIGNSGLSEKYYPAALEQVIAVASVGNDGRVSGFSTSGTHCDIAAPGENIISVGLKGYRTSSGTSHATPFVTGVLGLMRARANRAGRRLSIETCRKILRDTAQDTDPDAGPEGIGAGTLDAAAALRRTDEILQMEGEAHA